MYMSCFHHVSSHAIFYTYFSPFTKIHHLCKTPGQEPHGTHSRPAHIPVAFFSSPVQEKRLQLSPFTSVWASGQKERAPGEADKKSEHGGSVSWFSAGGTGQHLSVWYTARLWWIKGSARRSTLAMFSSKRKTPPWLCTAAVRGSRAVIMSWSYSGFLWFLERNDSTVYILNRKTYVGFSEINTGSKIYIQPLPVSGDDCLQLVAFLSTSIKKGVWKVHGNKRWSNFTKGLKVKTNCYPQLRMVRNNPGTTEAQTCHDLEASGTLTTIKRVLLHHGLRFFRLREKLLLQNKPLQDD